jgi:hypothetical protein
VFAATVGIETVIETEIGAGVSGENRTRIVLEKLGLQDRPFITILGPERGRLLINNRQALKPIGRIFHSSATMEAVWTRFPGSTYSPWTGVRLRHE